MDRWLEEYFAELETVFGLGLFEKKIRDSWDEKTSRLTENGTAEDTASEKKHNEETAAGHRGTKTDEIYGQLFESDEMLRELEKSDIWTADKYSAAAEPDLELELYSIQKDLWDKLPEKDGETGSMYAWKGDTESTGDLFLNEKGFPFANVLPPVLRMEQNRMDTAKSAAEWEKAVLWKDAVSARERPERNGTEENKFSLSFPQPAEEENDGLVDELLDELERRLMLEIGGTAEGRY